MNLTSKEIDKTYKLIDKISKKGKDNYLNYYSLIDDFISKGKYDILQQTLFIKYGIEVDGKVIDDIKESSWKKILFETNTSFQDEKYNLLKTNGIYQIGLNYFKESIRTSIEIIDDIGRGANLVPIIENGVISSIKIKSEGSMYSDNAVVKITGGIGQISTANLVIKSGRIYSVNVIYGGMFHNMDIRLGSIKEIDRFNLPSERESFQKYTKYKTTILESLIDGSYTPVTFSNWNTRLDYDKNLISLYKEAVEYLLLKIN